MTGGILSQKTPGPNNGIFQIKKLGHQPSRVTRDEAGGAALSSGYPLPNWKMEGGNGAERKVQDQLILQPLRLIRFGAQPLPSPHLPCQT